MDKKLIYDMLNGFIDCDRVSLPIGFSAELISEFEKSCEHLLTQIYESKMHLYDKLGNEDDEDVELIVNRIEELCRIISYKMYDLGRQQAVSN